ncbi:radical SAM protein [bacterium]|nr:radical SAM protein [bacterium]
MRPVFIKTFGCKVNYSESVSFADLLRQAGFAPLEISSARELSAATAQEAVPVHSTDSSPLDALTPSLIALANARSAEDEGELLLPSADEVERPVVFINSCCVTAEAERKAAQFVRRVRRLRPESIVLFSGCAARNYATREQYTEAGAQVFSFYTEAFDWLATLFPPAESTKSALGETMAETAGTSPGSRVLSPESVIVPARLKTLGREESPGDPGRRTQDSGQAPEGKQRLPTGLVGEARSRAFLKVQDGCHNCCSFCIIPFVRPYVSRPFDELLAEARARLAAGYREIVLTGVNVGHYGLTPIAPVHEIASQTHFKRSRLYERVPGHATLWDLIDALLARLDEHFERTGIAARLRISSIEPEEIEARFFEQLAHPRMCPHLHLPLQSGSEKVLIDMRRLYDMDTFMQRVAAFRRACPDGALTTDIITGYPTETEQDFADTLAVCTAAGFERIHGFPFSARPGTRAAMIPQQRDAQSIAQERNRRLIEHCAQIADQRWPRFAGKTAQVLIEEVRDGVAHGHGEAYQIVNAPAQDAAAESLVGTIVPLRLESYQAGEFRAGAPQQIDIRSAVESTSQPRIAMAESLSP